MSPSNHSAVLRVRLIPTRTIRDQANRVIQACAILADAGHAPVVVQVDHIGLGRFFADLLRTQADPALIQVQ